MTAKGFFEISRIINEVSEKVCNGKVILLITSGYNITVLPYSWYALAAGIAGYENDKDTIEDYYPAPRDPYQNQREVEAVVKELKRVLKQYWNCFR